MDQSRMDPARLDDIRALAWAKHENLATTSPAETVLVTESNALVTNVRSTSPCTNMIPAGSSWKSSQGPDGSAREIIISSEVNAPSKTKIELGSWSGPLPTDPPTEVTFNLESLDSLWYRNIDYTPFLCDRMVFPSDLERIKALISNQSPSKFLRLTVAQLARSVSSLIPLIDVVNDLENSKTSDSLLALRKKLEEKDGELLDCQKVVLYLTNKLFELEKERDNYKLGKEQADSLVDTYRTQVKNWEKKLGEKDEELQSLKNLVKNFNEVLRRKVVGTEESCNPMFQSGFDEAVMQMKHFNPNVTLDDSRLNRDVLLKTMIERGEA